MYYLDSFAKKRIKIVIISYFHPQNIGENRFKYVILHTI